MSLADACHFIDQRDYPNCHSLGCTNPSRDCRSRSFEEKCKPCFENWWSNGWKNVTVDPENANPDPRTHGKPQPGGEEETVNEKKPETVFCAYTSKSTKSGDVAVKETRNKPTATVLGASPVSKRTRSQGKRAAAKLSNRLQQYPKRTNVIIAIPPLPQRAIWHDVTLTRWYIRYRMRPGGRP
ncbi:MAG: hypothetical protein LQ352_004320 [Teloschistes flavicans]|nr:MAG: hypothetical protein LQ352_004320 [Teloschistes flavicans]